jgi:hypothetical protein
MTTDLKHECKGVQRYNDQKQFSRNRGKHESNRSSRVRPLAYTDVEDPKPAAGEVLVRVSATGINPADWRVRSGSVKSFIPIAFPLSRGL